MIYKCKKEQVGEKDFNEWDENGFNIAGFDPEFLRKAIKKGRGEDYDSEK